MRCEAVTTTGHRCREVRIAWLWLVEEHGILRALCTKHRPTVSNHITAKALREWMCREAAR